MLNAEWITNFADRHIVLLALAKVLAVAIVTTIAMIAGPIPLLIVALAASAFVAGRYLAAREATRTADELRAERAAHQATHAVLREAVNAARVTEAGRRRFLQSVNHELRSPLNAVYGYAQLLCRSEDESVKEAGRIIKRSTEHLTAIVDGLLDVTEVEGGTFRLDLGTTSLPALIDDVTTMFRAQAEAKGLAYEVARDELPDFVRTDAKRLRQVVINLLSNAVKFTDEGRVSVAVRHRSDVLSVAVTDTGAGIAEDQLVRVLTPFGRGAEANAKPGTGLGLPIVQALTHAMGGELTVKSEVGVGSVFAVRLRLPEVFADDIVPIEEGSVQGYEGHIRRALVVEDDPGQRGALVTYLETIGFEVLAAGTVREGTALGLRVTPDVALIDMHLPDGFGLDIASELRATYGRLVVTILMSASGADTVARGDRSFDAFLSKPLSFDDLTRTLAETTGVRWRRERVWSDDVGPTERDQRVPSVALLERVAAAARTGHTTGARKALFALEADSGESALSRRMKAHLEALDLKALANEAEEAMDGST